MLSVVQFCCKDPFFGFGLSSRSSIEGNAKKGRFSVRSANKAGAYGGKEASAKTWFAEMIVEED